MIKKLQKRSCKNLKPYPVSVWQISIRLYSAVQGVSILVAVELNQSVSVSVPSKWCSGLSVTSPEASSLQPITELAFRIGSFRLLVSPAGHSVAQHNRFEIALLSCVGLPAHPVVDEAIGALLHHISIDLGHPQRVAYVGPCVCEVAAWFLQCTGPRTLHCPEQRLLPWLLCVWEVLSVG